MASINNAATILIIEDDPIVAEIVAGYLMANEFSARIAGDAAQGLAMFTECAVDLAIIDVNLPDGSGFDLVPRLRASRDCGVIFLTSLGAADDRVRGLETGGDDYIVKPVELRELLARVRAVLRRYRHETPAPRPLSGGVPVLDIAGWTLDLVRRELADPGGALIRLTRAEFDLLAALAQANGVALSRDYLLEVVASAESQSKARTIDVMVSRVRRKLAAGHQPSPRIVTRQGEGYSFLAPAA